MKFDQREIIDTGASRTWAPLLRSVEVLNTGRNEWVFRALGKLKSMPKSSNTVEVTSSFDDACRRRSGGIPANDRWLYESWILSDFKREAQNYLSHLPEPHNFLEWMALGRHYGMPSRLVDFTYSFYVAAYFALSERRDGEDACIVALNLARMKEGWERRLRRSYKTFRGRAGSFHNPKLFNHFSFVRQDRYAVIVNPLRRNPRLANQQGCFLCPGSIRDEVDINLEQTLGSQGNVKRLFYLRSAVKADALKALRSMNIGQATLYPDLIGWAESRRDLIHLDISDERFRKELKVAIQEPRI